MTNLRAGSTKIQGTHHVELGLGSDVKGEKPRLPEKEKKRNEK